jgi:hypothetical protein
MFSKESLERVRIDFIFATNIIITSNIIEHFLINKELFSNTWLLSSFALITSFIFHALFLHNVNKVNEANIRLRRLVDDLLRFGSIFLITEIVGTYLIYNKVIISSNFIKRTVFTLLGILSYDYFFSHKIDNLGVYTLLINDLLKISVGSLASAFLLDGNISKSETSGLFGLLGGYIIWHLITSKLIIKSK